MTRTTPQEVKLALGDNYDTAGAPDLTGVITRASIIVARVVTCAAKKSVTLTSDELKELETLLACHFYGHQDQFYKSKNTDGAGATFMGTFGEGLKSSHYGQTALLIDHSGCLSSLGNSAGLVWVGKPKSAQTPYDDRD